MAQSSVSLLNTLVENNNCLTLAGNGGGIYLQGQSVLLGSSLVVRNNSAVQGGGIWCTAQININLKSSSVENNYANSTGGGFYAYQCHTLLAGTQLHWPNLEFQTKTLLMSHNIIAF